MIQIQVLKHEAINFLSDDMSMKLTQTGAWSQTANADEATLSVGYDDIEPMKRLIANKTVFFSDVKLSLLNVKFRRLLNDRF